MGNTITRNAKRSDSFRRTESRQIEGNKENFSNSASSSKNKSNELIKSLNRKGSSWSLGSLGQSRSLPGSVRSTYSTTSTRNKNTHHSLRRNNFYKTVWPTTSKELIFSSHFKRSSRSNEFSIADIIAKGAFGIVFKVKTKDNHFHKDNNTLQQEQQIYALKVLKKSKIVEDKAVQQIKDEIDIQKICSHHPFIVKHIDSWQNRSNLHILLEYIPCGELFTKIINFPYELIQLYVAEIASALDFLHNAGIIYRDVKPENILLTADYHIKLADFGLSKWLKFGEKTLTMCGTLQYMGRI